MTKLDWNRTDAGRDGYDAALTLEWRLGPSAPAFERPDGADDLKLVSTPTIYWAKELARAFPVDDEATHVRLFAASRRAAATLYFRNGWPLIGQRVQAVHLKSSTRNLFPSAFYAIYFDHWAMTFARGDHLNRLGSIPRHVEAFSRVGERWTRALVVLRILDTKHGRADLKSPSGFQDWLVGLNDKMKSDGLE